METIGNPKRGCGHMKTGAVYLRADLSTFGTLPAFVRICPAIPHQEPHFRGVAYVNGLALDHVMGWSVLDLAREISPAYRLDPEDDALNLTRRMTGDRYMARLREVCKGWSAQVEAEDRRERPQSAIPTPWVGEARDGMALDHVREGGFAGVNLGAFEEFWAFDLLDWVGESFYPTPESFIEEARTLGVNRRLPKGTFPKIVPGQTRIWFVHPKAVEVPGVEEKRPGLIGYSYLTRTIFTAPEGGQAVPEGMKMKAEAGLLDIVRLGPQEGEEVAPDPVQEDLLVEDAIQ